jgi:catechol 2,3-dioxygenase-like lactoylglutathione lyase family enzyme
MADPLDGLRLPIVPIEPRLEFANDLLQRISGRAPAHETPTVRYFVRDLDASIAFYCERLQFQEEVRSPPMFAMLYRGDLRLLLSLPGGHALPDGTLPTAGGWNRILLQVADLEATVATLRGQGVHFLEEIRTSFAVKQILLEDPSGNPIELFEPMAGYRARPR